MLSPEMLTKMPEDEFRRDVLVPLFEAMGFLDVQLQHGGILEQGKDIVMWKRDELRERVNYAVVAKSPPISGKASGASSAAEVVMQLKQCFGHPFQDAATLEAQDVHRCIVACPHDIKKEAQLSITSALDKPLARNVDFLCGQRLWQAIEKHLWPRTALGKLQDAGKLMEEASPHHRVVARVKGADVVFGIESKHADADVQEPLLFHGTFTFPNNEAGRAAMSALESHVKTGSPVTIPSEYITEWNVPEPLKAFMGEDVGQIQMFPAPSARVVTMDLSIDTASGRSETVSGLRLRGVQAGTEELTLTNADADSPYRFTLSANRVSRRISVSVSTDISGLNVKRALEVIKFRNAFAEGGQFTLRDSSTGLPFSTGDVPPGLVEATGDPFEEFVENLVLIQTKTKCLLAIPEREFELDDARAARTLADALRTGLQSTQVSNARFAMKREGIEKLLSEPANLGNIAFVTDTTDRILDTDVPVGRVARIVQGLEIAAADASRLRAELDTGADSADVTLVAKPDGGAMTVVFLDHMPPEERDRYVQFIQAS